jgi:DNA end-binding protein Ku
LEQVDPIYFNKSYYLEPEKNAAKPYVLLRDALEDSDRVAIVKVALRQRESLATLRVRDDVIVLETMIWPDEVRRPEFGFLDEDVTVRPQELEMARSLIESMTGDFEPEQYSDEYRAALERVIEAKVAGHEVVETPGEETKAPTGVVDLMAALRASVERAKEARGEGSAESGAATTKPTRAKSRPAAKKAAKSTARKAEPAAKAAKSGAARTGKKAAAKKTTAKTAQSGSRGTAKRTANSRRSA